MTLTSEEKKALAEYRIKKAKEIKAKMMDNKYIEYFKTLFARKTDVDYGDFELIDKEKAENSLNKAHEFLIIADRLLNELIRNLTK